MTEKIIGYFAAAFSVLGGAVAFVYKDSNKRLAEKEKFFYEKIDSNNKDHAEQIRDINKHYADQIQRYNETHRQDRDEWLNALQKISSTMEIFRSEVNLNISQLKEKIDSIKN